MRKLMFLVFLSLTGILIGLAQSRTVSGKVVSAADGEPIIGASVLVKGSSVGTITDINGSFTINVPTSSSVLTFSYIGMKATDAPATNGMTVRLEEDTEVLDEVIVVAYGTATKRSFTGSAAVIDASVIEKRQVSNLTNALSGQVAGVQVTSTNGQPGTTSTIRIRGIGSMASSNAPLYVVDGIPYDGDISSINTSDIESTTVLKDAASNALYGARGANGVILITTKKGKFGKQSISFDAKWGSNSRQVPNYDVMTDPAMYYEKFYEAINNSYLGQGKTAAEANTLANSDLLNQQKGGLGYLVYTLPSGESLIGLNGKLNPNATLGYSDGTYYYQPDDWYKEVFGKGSVRQEYNLNVSGADANYNYYVAGGYLDDSGLIPGSGFTRFSSRANGEYQVRKWLKIGANLSYTHYNMGSPASQTLEGSSVNVFNHANYIAPIYPFYVRNADKSIYIDSRGFTVYDFGDGTTGNFKRPTAVTGNPAMLSELDQRQYLADVFSGKWLAELQIIEGLKFTYKIGLDVDNTNYKRLYNAYYGQYSQQNGTSGIVYVGNTRTTGIDQQQLLTYKKTFNKLHEIDLLAGHETYSYKYSYMVGSKTKLYNPRIVEINNGINDPKAESYSNSYATEGYLFRAGYDYAGKYIASASFRRDASSRFHPDNRWGNFWSLGAAWVLNQESFLESQKWIDLLKFKISYGTQGNDKLMYRDGETINYYPYQDQYLLVDNNGEFANSLDYKGNPDITWETSHSFNTGFDFKLWKNKLSGSIEYFSRITTDLLYFRPVPVSLGYSHFPDNIGSISNSGIEIDLNGTVYKSRNISVNLYANATFLKNKILKLAPELGGELPDAPRIYKEGESLYQLYTRKYAGVSDKGQALYYIDKKDDKGNVISSDSTTTNYAAATQYALGDMLPKVYGGFGANVQAYGFDLGIACAYQLGGQVLDYAYQDFMHGGISNNAGTNFHKDMLNSWTPQNTNTDIPRVNSLDQYANSTSDRWLVSSNYLDITNITLGYTVPTQLIQKLTLNSVRVYVAADNLYLFTARQGLDPRQSYFSAGAYRYSAIRSISGGISIKF